MAESETTKTRAGRSAPGGARIARESRRCKSRSSRRSQKCDRPSHGRDFYHESGRGIFADRTSRGSPRVLADLLRVADPRGFLQIHYESRICADSCGSIMNRGSARIPAIHYESRISADLSRVADFRGSITSGGFARSGRVCGSALIGSRAPAPTRGLGQARIPAVVDP
jgi:hypothetical protein